jgi:hypothetical protein
MRLWRVVPRRTQIARTVAVALVLAALGIPAMVFADHFMPVVVGGLFALLSLGLLLSAVQQLFALRTPETIVDIYVHEIRRGEEVRFRFRQPGTGSFESLRANMVGEERWSERRRYSSKSVRHVKQLGTFPLFDSGPFEAPYDRTVDVRIPELPRAEPTHGEYWRLEVWGKVRGRADFRHVYDLRVQR